MSASMSMQMEVKVLFLSNLSYQQEVVSFSANF